MMRTILLAAGTVFGLIGSTHAQEANPSPYVARDFHPGSFQKIEIAGPFRALVSVEDGPATVRVIGPPALLADTVATVIGDTLTIRFREGSRWSWNPGSGMNVTVAVPSLASAHATGAAQIDVYQVHGQDFSAATDGSGAITLHDLDVGRAQFATAGSGGITAEGRAREAAYKVGGSGSIDAKRLRAETATIAIGGSGSIYADVSRTANVSVGGSGRVDVVGGATCVKGSARSSQVECR